MPRDLSQFFVGAWCSTASTSVSKTEGPGSIPGAPAIHGSFAAQIKSNSITEVVVIKRLWGTVVEFVSDVKSELKKVSYPTKAETLGSTTVVLLFCIIMSMYLSFVDSLLVRIISKVL